MRARVRRAATGTARGVTAGRRTPQRTVKSMMFDNAIVPRQGPRLNE